MTARSFALALMTVGSVLLAGCDGDAAVTVTRTETAVSGADNEYALPPDPWPASADFPIEFDESADPFGGLTVVISFDRALTGKERAFLDRLLTAWYDVGSMGGFGDVFTFGEEPRFLRGGRVVEADYEIHEVSNVPYDVLARILKGFAAVEGVSVKKLLFTSSCDDVSVC